VPRRIDVGGVVGAEGQRLPGPALAGAQELARDAEELLDLLRAALVVEELDGRALEGRRVGRALLDRGGQVEDPDRATVSTDRGRLQQRC
jgi:hypothetical protein